MVKSVEKGTIQRDIFQVVKLESVKPQVTNEKVPKNQLAQYSKIKTLPENYLSEEEQNLIAIRN